MRGWYVFLAGVGLGVASGLIFPMVLLLTLAATVPIPPGWAVHAAGEFVVPVVSLVLCGAAGNPLDSAPGQCAGGPSC
jgi:hypothetical protein